MTSYAAAGMERAMKGTGSNFAGAGEADQLVAGGGDHRDQRAADAALASALWHLSIILCLGSGS